jgi:diguanylate cyclase (GGDEF)-like protein
VRRGVTRAQVDRKAGAGTSVGVAHWDFRVVCGRPGSSHARGHSCIRSNARPECGPCRFRIVRPIEAPARGRPAARHAEPRSSLRQVPAPSLRRRILRFQRSLLFAAGPVAMARALGLLGLSAATFGVLTWPLVPSGVSGEARGLILVGAALASGLLLAAPARWLVRAPVSITVAAAIALQTTYTIVTGRHASPYFAGFLAIVLVVAFFTNPRRSLGVTLVSMAGLFSVFYSDGSLSVTDAATLASTTVLTLMMAVSTSWLASRQRRQVRRLARRMARVRAEAAQRHAESLTDPLTGLGNRRAFDLALASALGDRHRTRPLVLVLADLDGLKQVNDEHGHLAGDQVLIAVATALSGALRDMLRASDRVYRIGGDEFAALVFGPDQAVLASRLAYGVRAHLPGVGRVRASVGIAAAMEHDTPEALFARADAALYAAKQQRGSSRSDDSNGGADLMARSGDVVPGRLIETRPRARNPRRRGSKDRGGPGRDRPGQSPVCLAPRHATEVGDVPRGCGCLA